MLFAHCCMIVLICHELCKYVHKKIIELFIVTPSLMIFVVKPKVASSAINQSLTGIKGERLTLKFQILDANPVVDTNQIQWYYNDTLEIRNLASLNGVELEFSSDYRTLNMTNTDYTIAGKFTLVASNLGGEDMDYINVKIEG